jgi:hypothetical protein
MGYSLSWVAVRGKTAEEVLRELGLRATGEREEIPESPIVAAKLNDQLYLVLANNDSRFAEDEGLRRLSVGCELISCFVEEHVMCSRAAAWKGGEERWSVSHDAQIGIEHLEAKGALPSSYSGIRDRLAAERGKAGPDAADFLFDVPVELAKAETGFRHDQDCPGGAAEPFEVLVSDGGRNKRSWIARLLGD